MTYSINEPPYKYFQATTAQSGTVVKANPGILHTVTINNIGATGVSITLADASGNIAVITAPTAIATLEYDVGFTSLTVTSAGTTPPGFTISYS